MCRLPFLAVVTVMVAVLGGQAAAATGPTTTTVVGEGDRSHPEPDWTDDEPDWTGDEPDWGALDEVDEWVRGARIWPDAVPADPVVVAPTYTG